MKKANLVRRQSAYRLWHRQKSQSYILRTQLGFDRLTNSRPDCCVGCVNYHGRAYGNTLSNRTIFICGFHPSGWSASVTCPDWQDNI